jgi:hypothetical protein
MLFIGSMMLNTLMTTENKNKTCDECDDPCDDCSDHNVLSDWIKPQPIKKEVDNENES